MVKEIGRRGVSVFLQVQLAKSNHVNINEFTNISGLPAILSNYNFMVTRELVGKILEQLRRDQRECRTATEDLMKVVDDWVSAGWAKIVRDLKKIHLEKLPVTCFHSIAPAAAVVSSIKGIADVVQTNDTQNITVWDMPFLRFLA